MVMEKIFRNASCSTALYCLYMSNTYNCWAYLLKKYQFYVAPQKR